MHPSLPSAPIDVDSCRPALFGVGLLSAIIIVVFFPGVMTPDSEAILKQARTLQLTDWHPPVMALIWRYLDAIVRGPLLMLVSQALLYAWGTAKLCTEAFPAINRRIPWWTLMFVFGLFPPAMALIGVIWKDVWMSGFLLLALGYLSAMPGKPSGQSRLRAFIALACCCVLATAFRHNAVSATAGLLAGGSYFLLEPRHGHWIRLLLACAAGLLLAGVFWLASGIFTRLTTAPSHPTTSILLHDIAGMIVNASNPEGEASYLLIRHPAVSSRPKDLFMNQLRQSYKPEDANGILRTSRRINVPFDVVVYDRNHNATAVKSAWRGLLRRNPAAYLTHRWNAFRCLLQLCDRQAWATRSYVLNSQYLGTETSSAIQAKLRRTLLNPGLVRMYSPALWLCLCLVSAIMSLLLGKGRDSLPFFMGLSALGLAFSLFFTVPIESYRYMHWVVLLGWACVFMAIEAILQRWCRREMRHSESTSNTTGNVGSHSQAK